MDTKQKKIVSKLIKYGKDFLDKPREFHNFSKVKEANDLTNDIENHPNFFVLSCPMDRQIKAERAWLIPYKISKIIGGVKFEQFAKLSQEEIKKIFLENNLHRFNKDIAKLFYKTIQRIKNQYNRDASNI